MADSIIKMTGGVIRQQANTILKNVNIEIQSGEFIYLIGKVGSGKSSFLKTLYAELPLEYGTAEVAGFQLKKIKKSQIPLLRRKCGIVFRILYKYHYSVENAELYSIIWNLHSGLPDGKTKKPSKKESKTYWKK